ncbi:MAG: peptide deformylase [Phycisphaeraceae bacterium]
MPTISAMPVDPQTLRIVHYPEPVLRRKAKPVEAVTGEVRAVAARMIELMHEAQGVGLAAPQVGLAWRLFVANVTGEPGDDRIYINPVLREPSRATEPHDEGCLSIPHVTAEVTRPLAITIDALDEQGKPFTLTAEGLPARVWQHETDHLDGVLILDRMTPADRIANKRAIRELERA